MRASRDKQNKAYNPAAAVTKKSQRKVCIIWKIPVDIQLLTRNSLKGDIFIMVIASIVLGILFIAAGVTCMSAPIDTYLKAAYFLAILLFVYGIFGIVRFAKKRTGETGLAVSILALLIGAVYLFRPGGRRGRNGRVNRNRIPCPGGPPPSKKDAPKAMSLT